MYELSGIMNSLTDLDAMLERLLDVGLGIVSAERGLIILLNEAGEQEVAAARDLEDETVRDALEYSHNVVKEAASGQVVVSLDADQDDRFRKYQSVNLYAIKSLMCVPMRVRERVIGTVYVDSRRQGIPFTEQDLRFLEAFANLAAAAVEQARLHERLATENVYLKREAGERNRYQNIIGRNVKMQAVYDLMEKVAASNLPVLIQGESGTGKELVARALHYSGPRRTRKFYSENVAAIPDTLLESEMFGHVRGAFTGADRDRKGLFELADGGTLFLDEIGDMSLPLQAKLLRALQDGEIRPVGGKESRRVDVRILSATNKDLEQMMREKRFREDLYYRLNVVRIPLPPLRERKEDIPLLVDHFLQKAARETGAPPRRIDMSTMQLLLRYAWPGNIRELENEIMRLAVLCQGEVITQRDLMENAELYDKITSLDEQAGFTPLEEMERRQIEKALMEAAGNRGRAAEMLGISRATIFRKLRKFNIAH
jgi:Nif-specific regulatory protein